MSTTNQLYTTFHNGIKMPLLGLGVYDMHNAEAEKAVEDALEIGYRLIDTASLYRNEKEIGNAIRKSAVPREEIFVTTKLGNGDQGFESSLKAFDTSLKLLNIDYIDCYLVHWPIRGKRKESWLALEKLYSEKRVRSIGVANYLIPFLDELSTYATDVPVLNQVEFSPYLYLKDLMEYCQQRNIQLQSYTPLVRGKKFSDPRILAIAARHVKSPAQIILRWNMEHGVSAIPKSSNKVRLQENFDIFDFSLTTAEMKEMDSWNENYRVVDNPMDYY